MLRTFKPFTINLSNSFWGDTIFWEMKLNLYNLHFKEICKFLSSRDIQPQFFYFVNFCKVLQIGLTLVPLRINILIKWLWELQTKCFILFHKTHFFVSNVWLSAVFFMVKIDNHRISVWKTRNNLQLTGPCIITHSIASSPHCDYQFEILL